MNYEDGIKLLPSLDRLKGKELLISKEWDIIHVGLLPVLKDTLLAYIPILDGAANNHWMANGVNHEGVYKRSGIYYKQDGTHFDDDLTFYIILKNRVNPLHVEYKCETLVTLLHQNEIRKEDIPNFVLQNL